MYMPGRRRTASSPSSTWLCSAPYLFVIFSRGTFNRLLPLPSEPLAPFAPFVPFTLISSAMLYILLNLAAQRNRTQPPMPPRGHPQEYQGHEAESLFFFLGVLRVLGALV